jgi:hypothetical protein
LLVASPVMAVPCARASLTSRCASALPCASACLGLLALLSCSSLSAAASASSFCFCASSAAACSAHFALRQVCHAVGQLIKQVVERAEFGDRFPDCLQILVLVDQAGQRIAGVLVFTHG